ncbi:hypothetical protein ACWGSK_26810 [Nocardiopsis sp. NPDC055551]|uniref:hypothetical protein n=1 Tax=Nocardiopsis sp. NPDC006832 TaxID=3157188 RepID=UPI0033FA0A51
MTAHSVVLCALLLCVPPPPTDGVAPCPTSVPSATPATDLPESPSSRAISPDVDAEAPDTDADADAGTGFLGPLADCVAVLEDEASGGDDAEGRVDESEDPGEDIDPSAPAPDPTEPTSEPSAVPESSPAVPEAEPEAEPTHESEQTEGDGAASVVAESPPPSPSPSPTPEPRPAEGGTVSRASDTARPTPSGDHDQDLGERPPSKKVEEPQEMDSVDGLAFEETSATSVFGRAVGVTSTTLLFLLAAGTLGLRLAVGWPRFPPLYLGRRRLSDDLDVH